MKLEIKRVGILQLASVFGLGYLIVTLCVLPFAILVFGTGPAYSIGFAIGYVGSLFVIQLIGALVYNLVARMIGGIFIDVKDNTFAELERAKALVEQGSVSERARALVEEASSRA
jgi:hypothetical protein